MAKIQIIVGSVMGTAAGVARSVQTVLEGFGHEVRLVENFEAQQFDLKSIILVCTSNTGMGDLPENITPFYSHLVTQYPAIAGTPYGIINLGDSSYPNFAEAGKLMDDTLADLGARRLGEPLVLDAILVDDHEQEAATWIAQWQALIEA